MLIQKSISLQLLFAGVFDHIIAKGQNQSTALSADITQDEVFTLVVNNYVDKLYRYINYTFNLQKHATDDIVQEIYLNLPKKLRHFDLNKKLDPRLYRVAHNVALDYIKKNKRKSEKEIQLDIVATEDFLYKMSTYEGDMPRNLELAYNEGLLRLVLGKMDERNRYMVILYYFEHKSYEEVAIIIGVKSSGIGTLLARAKKQLKFLIEQDPLLHDALIYDLNVQRETA